MNMHSSALALQRAVDPAETAFAIDVIAGLTHQDRKSTRLNSSHSA